MGTETSPELSGGPELYSLRPLPESEFVSRPSEHPGDTGKFAADCLWICPIALAGPRILLRAHAGDDDGPATGHDDPAFFNLEISRSIQLAYAALDGGGLRKCILHFPVATV